MTREALPSLIQDAAPGRYLVTWDDRGLTKQEVLTFLEVEFDGFARFRSDLGTPVTFPVEVVKSMEAT